MAEHTITLKLPGNPDSLRPRLLAALTQLDYVTLHDQPIQAHRQARRLGGASTNVLNYSMDLTIGLSALGTEATEATFLYEWKTTWGAIGDRPTLSKEAEALAALALLHLKQTVCTGCGREQTAEAKFCRACGLSLASTVPAELEVLKLMAAANAAAKSNSFHLTVGMVALPLLTLAVLLTKQAMPFFWFAMAMSIVFWLCSAFGATRLMEAIGAKLEKRKELLTPSTSNSPQQLEALKPYAQALPSITEDTTRLLHMPIVRQAEAVPRRNTNDL